MIIHSLLPLSKPLLYTLAAVIGLCVGSFCNVVIYRLPAMLFASWRRDSMELLQQIAQQEASSAPPVATSPASLAKFNLASPASHCPHCKKPIPFYQNIPLLSFLCLRGRCHFCRAKIGWRYPLVELLCAAATVAVVYHCGPTWQVVALLPLTWGLLVLIFIDCDHQILPDAITMPLLWLGLLVNATFQLFTTPASAILGAVMGYSVLWLIAGLFKLVRKKEGMGHGDFKLLALFGAWLGWQLLPLLLFIAALAGSVIGIAVITLGKKHFAAPLPFGPYLACVGWLMFFVGADVLTTWCQRIMFFA